MPRRRVIQNQDGESEINVSPILDMVFILLIFFVVTTTFSRETGVDVNKPKASSVSRVKDKTIKMAVTREGTIHIHEKQVSLDELENILKRAHARNPGVQAIIIADEKSETGMMMKVLDRCNSVGLKKTSVAANAD